MARRLVVSQLQPGVVECPEDGLQRSSSSQREHQEVEHAQQVRLGHDGLMAVRNHSKIAADADQFDDRPDGRRQPVLPPGNDFDGHAKLL